jgi:hypothetical protein
VRDATNRGSTATQQKEWYMGFRLKGSATGTGNRIRRPAEFKATVLAAVEKGEKAKEALANACKVFKLPINKSYIEHPHTFIGQFRASVEKVVLDEKNASHEAVVSILRDADMLEDTPDDEDGEEVTLTADDLGTIAVLPLSTRDPARVIEFGDSDGSDVPDDLEAIEADRASE